MIHQTPYNHGNWKPEKKHGIDKSQLFGRKAKFLAQLREDSCPDRKSKGGSDECKATSVKQGTSVNVFVC